MDRKLQRTPKISDSLASDSLRVLYEDNHCIAVVKPAGVLVQGDASGEKSLMDIVKEYLKEKYKKPGNVFLGLVHRLDKPVSGIVIFARTSKGAARLSEQFRNHTAKKIYEAWVIGIPKTQGGTLVHFLRKNEKTLRAEIFEHEESDTQRAELHYEIIKTENGNALLRIELKTGRFHQIRAQLSAIGHPILGDVKYGAPEQFPDQSIALEAVELIFETATTKEMVHLTTSADTGEVI